MSELSDLQREYGAWGRETFPNSTPLTIVSHLVEEVREVSQAVHLMNDDDPVGIAEEAADCMLLLMHLADRLGFDLLDAAKTKFAVDQRRTWKTTPEPGGHVKHETEVAR